MQHINLSNYKGSITDWTELNYINGGLADNLADISNIKVNDSCYNYLAKSANLIKLNDVAETTTNGITWKVENGLIYLNGTSTAQVNIWLSIPTIASGKTIAFKDFGDMLNYSINTIQAYLAKAPSNYGDRFALSNNGQFFSGTTSFDYPILQIYVGSGSTINNAVLKPMIVSGTTTPTAYEPYGALVIHQNAARLFGSTYASNIIVITNRPGLRCVVIQTDKNLVNNNDTVIVAKNNLGLTAISGTAQWATTQTNVFGCNDQGRILINFDQSLTDDEMIEKAKTLILDYQLLNPTTIVLKSVDLGTLDWTRRQDITAVNCFSTGALTDYKHSLDVQASCSKYNFVGTVTTYVSMNDKPNKSLALYVVTNNTNSALYVNDNDYETANDFKAAMNGVILLYEPKE